MSQMPQPIAAPSSSPKLHTISNALDTTALENLIAIVEEGSFERAARRLCITQSAVSQRLCGLEAQVGTILIIRSRPPKATEAGQLLVKHTKQMRLLYADIEIQLRKLVLRGKRRIDEATRVSVAINDDCIAGWAFPPLTKLVHTGISVEIFADSLDATNQLLRTGQVMGCITTDSRALAGCRMRPLGAMRYVAVAQPSFISQQLPNGLTQFNFLDVPFVAVNRKDDIQNQFISSFFALNRVSLSKVYLPNAETLLRAVHDGWGIGIVSELVARESLKSGRLVDLAPDQDFRIPMFWHCWNLESEVLESLERAVVSAAASSLA